MTICTCIDWPDTSPDTTAAPLAQSRTYPRQAGQAITLLPRAKVYIILKIVYTITYTSTLYVPDICRCGGNAWQGLITFLINSLTKWVLTALDDEGVVSSGLSLLTDGERMIAVKGEQTLIGGLALLSIYNCKSRPKLWCIRIKIGIESY